MIHPALPLAIAVAAVLAGWALGGVLSPPARGWWRAACAVAALAFARPVLSPAWPEYEVVAEVARWLLLPLASVVAWIAWQQRSHGYAPHRWVCVGTAGAIAAALACWAIDFIRPDLASALQWIIFPALLAVFGGSFFVASVIRSRQEV